MERKCGVFYIGSVVCFVNVDILFFNLLSISHILHIVCCGGFLFGSKWVACVEREGGVFSIRSVVCFVTYIFETQCAMVKS